MTERPKIIPVMEHRNYVLLWDLADEMAKEKGKSAEGCWLAIMDAFWVGKLPALFIFCPRKGRMNGRVVTKTADQLDLQALHRVRERLVSQRTGIINQIRAFLLERGLRYGRAFGSCAPSCRAFSLHRPRCCRPA